MKKLLIILIGLCFLVPAGPVSADDIFPPWYYGQPGSQYAIWETWTDSAIPPNPPSSYADYWETWDGVYGPLLNSPTVSLKSGGTYLPYWPDDTGRLDVWQVNADDGLVFYLDNYDDPKLYKFVRIQITYYDPVGAINPDEFKVTTDIHEFFPAELVGSENWGDGWFTEAFDFVLSPNPVQEWIGLRFNDYTDGVYIDQVVIDTWCTDDPSPVPIPGAVWLLGSGLIGLVGLRRKFQG